MAKAVRKLSVFFLDFKICQISKFKMQRVESLRGQKIFFQLVSTQECSSAVIRELIAAKACQIFCFDTFLIPAAKSEITRLQRI